MSAGVNVSVVGDRTRAFLVAVALVFVELIVLLVTSGTEAALSDDQAGTVAVEFSGLGSLVFLVLLVFVFGFPWSTLVIAGLTVVIVQVTRWVERAVRTGRDPRGAVTQGTVGVLALLWVPQVALLAVPAFLAPLPRAMAVGLLVLASVLFLAMAWPLVAWAVRPSSLGPRGVRARRAAR